MSTFELSSPAIAAGGPIGHEQVFNGGGLDGANLSPPLQWRDAPAGTKSFALTVHDPDAPTGSGWWHWTVYDIPASVTQLPAGAGDASGGNLPAGARQTRNDFGLAGYGGPCPPPGPAHRYVFTLYALKTDRLDVPPDSTPAMIGFMIHFNQIGSATFTGLYGR